tara:strand:- start:247 stop:492 length:246 start_codon:yes stop_codon:yes gene_type:complete
LNFILINKGKLIAFKVGGQTGDEGPMNKPMDGPTDGPSNERTSWIFEDSSVPNMAIPEVRVAKRVTQILFAVWARMICSPV